MAGVSKFTEAIGDVICERIASGESVRAICADSTMPAMSTVFKWLAENKTFSEQYAHARASQMESMAQEILDIADSADSDNVNPCRLQVDTRKWLMSKLAPKRYGDKVQNEVSGPDGNPIQAAIAVTFVRTNPETKDL